MFLKLNDPSSYFEHNPIYRRIFPYIQSNVDELIGKPVFESYTNDITGYITHAWINEDQMVMITFRLYKVIYGKLRISSHFSISRDVGINIVGCNLVPYQDGIGPLVGKVTHLVKLQNTVQFILNREIDMTQ